MHRTYLRKTRGTESLLCDSIYLKFETKENESLVLEFREVVTLRGRERPVRNTEISKLLDRRKRKQIQSQLQ